MGVVAASLMVVGAASVDAQSPAPPIDPGPPCGIEDLDDFRLTVGPGEVGDGHRLQWQVEDPEPAPLDDMFDRRVAEGVDHLDLVAGTELRVQAAVMDQSRRHVQRAIPVRSVVATLSLKGAPPVWLAGTVASDGTASLRLQPVPLGERPWPPVTGDGTLAVRVGVCDGWSQAAYARVTVADPAAIADCPTKVLDVDAYVPHLDRRMRVGRSVVPDRDVWSASGRYATEPDRRDTGAWGGVSYWPASPPIRVAPRADLRVRFADRDNAIVEPSVWWVDAPPAQQIRDRLVQSIYENQKDARPRSDGEGGYRVTAPRKPGRYLLVDASTWQDHCVEVTEGYMLAIVEVR